MEKNDVCSLCHTPSNLQPEFADAAVMAGSVHMPLRIPTNARSGC